MLRRRRRIVRVLDRLARVCFQRSPMDYEALDAYLDQMARHDT